MGLLLLLVLLAENVAEKWKNLGKIIDIGPNNCACKLIINQIVV